MEKAEIQSLIRDAFEAQKFAYVPYSRFHVGAALLGKNGTAARWGRRTPLSPAPAGSAARHCLSSAARA